MGVKVTMDTGAAYVAHEARTEGMVNAHPVTVYVVREATTGNVVGEVRREARPSMDGPPGMDVMWVHADGAADALWRAVRAVVGGKVANVETTDDAPLCEVCSERPATDETRDVNANGPWVAVCGDACGDAVVTHADDCDCTNCEDERDDAPRYVGVVFMGANYSAPDAATGAYVWNTLDGVRASVESIRSGRGVDALVAEWRDNGAAGAGEFDDSLTPCADDVRVYVYANGPGALEAMEESLDYAERVVYVGPRGGVRVSADLTAGAR